MELRAVYVLVQLYAFFENGLYFNTSVEACAWGLGTYLIQISGTHMASHVWCGLSATYLAQTSYIFRPLNEAPYLIHIGYLYFMCQICVRIFDTYMVHCLIKFDIRWVCSAGWSIYTV